MNIAASKIAIGAAPAWLDANQRYLMDALAVIRGYLEQLGAHLPCDSGAPDQTPALADALKAMAAPPAIDAIAVTFGLSSFERDVLLLCAGVELDTGFATSCAAAQGGSEAKPSDVRLGPLRPTRRALERPLSDCPAAPFPPH
jgi:hypothetical protein